ncbi:MAG: hypothetical protein A2081_03065 [Elusimicrobia bacterium GWC2_61_19]|nr:MAG: hypothetical protein A2081_03065 [Elusimicrobia bacterium GWC2_61_19]
MKTLILGLILLAAAGAARAAEAKPVWKWVTANEYYLILPSAQSLHISGAGNESVRPWGFGFMAVGNETFSKAGGLQLRGVKVDSPAIGPKTFYMLDMLLGMHYMTPKAPGKPLRFKAGAFADFGLSDTTLYMAPVIAAGLLYTTSETAETPNGFTFDITYRPTDIDLDNVGGGRSGALKPALGFKVGYIFEGFWSVKNKIGT